MNELKPEETEKILRLLEKKNNNDNLERLKYIFTLFQHLNHPRLTFYQYVNDFYKLRLIDKITIKSIWSIIKNEIIQIIYLILFIGLVIYLIADFFIFQRYIGYNIGNLNIINLLTVLITSLFFGIKIYIDNKQQREEIRVYKEMEERFDRQDEKMENF